MIDKKIKITALTFLISTIAIIAQINSPSVYPDRVILNLTESPSTSVAVTWRTDVSVLEGYCELQPASDGPVKRENSKTFKAKTTFTNHIYGEEPAIKANQHSYVFTNLTPDEKYLYRVGSDEYWSEWYEFKTPAKEGKFSFIYLGDSQSDLKSQWSRVIRSAYRHAPESEFILTSGDLINRAGRDLEWHEWFYAGSFIYSMMPQVMTPGNHEYKDMVLDPHWNTQFTLPANGPKGLEGTSFVVDYNNMKLIIIDSAVESELRYKDGNKLETQKVWLDSVLQSNTKEWVIVSTHLPFYSPKENRDNKHLRDNFQPILEKYKVDLVLSGHDHSYGRGKYTDNPDNNHKVMYVVSVSGPKMYEAGDKDWMERSGAFKQLYQIISIEDNVLKLESFTTDGKLFDSFTMIK